MARLPLVGKPYTSKALIAANQRMVNLYAEENNDPQAVSPITLFPMPGTVAFGTPATLGPTRGSYRTSLGKVYQVVGSALYFVSVNGAMSLVGNIADRPSQVIMADNGLSLIVVDGTEGWVVDLATNEFAQITDPSFYGAAFVVFLDTFFVFDRPNTNQFYISLSMVNFDLLSSTGIGTGIIIDGGDGSILTGSIQNSGAAGAISAGAISNSGSSYTPGTYTNVPLTGGSGTGARATIVVTNGGFFVGGYITSVTITNNGTGYTNGNILSAASADLGGGGGFAWTVSAVSAAAYTNGTYNNVPLTGGSGTGALATIVVASNIINSVTITDGGIGYVVGDILSANTSDLGGGAGSGFAWSVLTIDNYTDGTYSNVPLTGGSGTGATANITILGGVVIGVEIVLSGKNYMSGDLLSASNADLGGTGSGFQWEVLTPATAFDPLDIAAKSGSADYIVAIATRHKELLLIGELTTENWIGTGAADFYFQLQQGAYIDHGCAAPYSVVSSDVLTCWIMKDKQGSGTIVQSVGYELKEISTPGIVAEIKAYADLSDATGTFFQMADHLFYVLSFPTANKTWFYDISSGIWGEWSWLNTDDGSNNRARIAYAFFAFDKNYISDWETGKIWKLDLSVYTDNDVPIIRMRTFTHLVGNDFERITYKSFDADIECGNSPQIDESLGEQLPMIDLSWSDDRGKTFGNPVSQSLGNQGEYLTTVSWNRLGYARDRVFKLQWSAPIKTALNGSFITVSPGRS